MVALAYKPRYGALKPMGARPHPLHKIVFASPACAVAIDGRGRAVVTGFTPFPWSPPAVNTGAFLEALATVRQDDTWQDQAAVHAFLKEQITKG